MVLNLSYHPINIKIILIIKCQHNYIFKTMKGRLKSLSPKDKVAIQVSKRIKKTLRKNKPNMRMIQMTVRIT